MCAFPCRLPHAPVHELDDVLVEVIDELREVLLVGERAETLPPHPVHDELLVDPSLGNHPSPRLVVPGSQTLGFCIQCLHYKPV
jgi:hypothetical protein